MQSLTKLILVLITIVFFGCKSDKEDQKSLFYIGTMTSDSNNGIKLANLNTKTGEIGLLQTVAKVNSPNFIDIDPVSGSLFCVSEKYQDSLKTNYFVNLYDINESTGELQFVNEEKVFGEHPCYIEYSRKNNKLMTANYISGNNSFFSISDNKITFTNSFQHNGTGPDSTRQEAPHAHSIKTDPEEKYAYSADLGADKIYVFNIEDNQNSIVDSILCKPGSGPRHIEFSPDHTIMTVVNELNSTISVFKKDSQQIFNQLAQTISMLPDTFKGFSKAADIHFSKDGNFLYASNRGYNSIVIYKNNNSNLKLVGWETEGINWPRNFSLDPSDNYLLVANKNDNNITIYKRNQTSGLLKKRNFTLPVNTPVCIKFLQY